MKKHKLVLVFDDEVLGVDPVMIFNNPIDANNHLLFSTGKFVDVVFNFDNMSFSFRTKSTWTGYGSIYWAVDNS